MIPTARWSYLAFPCSQRQAVLAVIAFPTSARAPSTRYTLARPTPSLLAISERLMPSFLKPANLQRRAARKRSL